VAQANDTLSDLSITEPLPTLPIDEPTLNLSIFPNDSPLAGQDGNASNLNSLKQRIYGAAEDDIAMNVHDIPGGMMT